MSADDHAAATRRERWRQMPETRIADPDDARLLIDQVGVATLYPASTEFPSLFHAYMGDPDAKTDSGHDSPSGEVYAWRWALGRQGAAFYSVLVRGRPTWVSWALFPAILRLCGEQRSPDELYRAGELSADAYRVTQALDMAGGVLGTADLRREAGFPTGKLQRAAYLRAVQELDSRLLLAKVFSPGMDEQDMLHALVRTRYPEHAAASEQMTRVAAVDAFLSVYLASAVYAVPAILAKHLKLPEADLRAGLDCLAALGRVTAPDQQVDRFQWQDR